MDPVQRLQMRPMLEEWFRTKSQELTTMGMRFPFGNLLAIL